MFRFDSFRKADTANASIISTDEQSEQLEKPRPANFLQRMASAETLLHSSTASAIKRPSFSKLHNSFSSSSGSSSQSSSLSIPVPANSWGMLALSRLRAADDGEFDDVLDLLLTREKAVLLLPVSQPSHPSAIIDREFIQDHVIVYQNRGDQSQGISLSGIRGTFQSDQFVALELLPAGREVSSINNGPYAKKSLFDTFNLDPSSITVDCPRYNILHNHLQLPLRDDKTITAMLIQKPLSRTEVADWVKKNEEEAKNASTTSAARLAESIGSDPRVTEFIKSYRRRPPRNLDTASNQFLDFMDDLADTLNDDDERVDEIEAYICYELYDCLFSTPGGDEPLQDEALESRIAALNLLDLNLSHLGVIVEDDTDIKDINAVVKEAGTQLQQLNSIPDAEGKLRGLVKTHQIVVDAIEGFAEKYRQAKLDTESEVVQEMKHAMSTVNEEEKGMIRKPSANGKNETGPLDENPAREAGSESPAASTGSDSQTLGAASADVLLPLLIFSIVKSNPTNFLSNLRFIQRFRRPSRITGQESYCLTNMMAAVSFLETTNLVGLGLSADKILSPNPHLDSRDDSSLPPPLPSPPPPQTPPKTPSDPPRSMSIDAAQAGGLKLMSEMVDNSYKMFDGLGRLWQRDAPKTSGKGSTSAVVASTSMTGAAAESSSVRPFPAATESELKDMPSNKNPLRDDGSSSWSSRFIENRNRRPDALNALLQAPSQFIHSVSNNSSNDMEGPIQKFLEVKSVEELKIGEVAELLADYKRMAAIMKQAGLC